jgi:hypothetical protein
MQMDKIWSKLNNTHILKLSYECILSEETWVTQGKLEGLTPMKSEQAWNGLYCAAAYIIDVLV